jgi:hypothetical protein
VKQRELMRIKHQFVVFDVEEKIAVVFRAEKIEHRELPNASCPDGEATIVGEQISGRCPNMVDVAVDRDPL